MSVLRDIGPWLPGGLQGRVVKVIVVTVFIKLGLAVVAGVVLLILYATGHL